MGRDSRFFLKSDCVYIQTLLTHIHTCGLTPIIQGDISCNINKIIMKQKYLHNLMGCSQ